MTLMQATVGMSNDIVISNLKLLSEFEKDDKPVTREQRISKENRIMFVTLRRGMEGAFNVEVVSQTFAKAVQIVKFAETDQVFYEGGMRRFEQVGKVKKYAPKALQKLLVIKTTYLSEKKQATADELQKIHLQYLSTFPSGKTNPPSILKKLTPNPAEGFENPEVKRAASKARSFWLSKEASATETPRKSLPRVKAGGIKGVRFRSDPILPPPTVFIPLPIPALETCNQAISASPQERKTVALLCQIADRSLQKNKQFEKKQVQPYVEKGTIREIIRNSKETSKKKGVLDELRAFCAILPERLKSVHQELDASMKSIAENNGSKEKNRSYKKKFNLSLLDRVRNCFKDKLDSHGHMAASSSSSTSWVEEEQMVESARSQLTRKSDRAPLNRTISVVDLASRQKNKPNSSNIDGATSLPNNIRSKQNSIKRSISLSGTDFVRNIKELIQDEEAIRLSTVLKERRQKLHDSDSESELHPASNWSDSSCESDSD